MFVIQDWAGQYPFGEITFDTFEDGWEYVYENAVFDEIDKNCENRFDDFYVLPIENKLTTLKTR